MTIAIRIVTWLLAACGLWQVAHGNTLLACITVGIALTASEWLGEQSR